MKKLTNFNDVKKYIESHEFDTQAAPSAVYLADMVFHAYSNTDKIHPVAYSPQFCFVKNNYFWQLTPEVNLKLMAESMYSEYCKDPISFKRFLIDQKKVFDSLENIWRESKNKERITHDMFSNFFDKCQEWWLYGVIGEDKGKIAQDALVNKLVRRLGITPEKAYELTSTLSHPDLLSGFAQEKVEFLKLCIKAKNSASVINPDIASYIELFFYKNTSFYDYELINVESVTKRINDKNSVTTISELNLELDEIFKTHEFIMKEKVSIKQNLQFTKDEMITLEYLQIITQWVDDRKIYMMKQFFYLISFVHRIADQYKIKYEDIALYPFKAVSQLLMAGNKLSPAETANFSTGTMFCYQSGVDSILFKDREAEELFKIAQHVKETDNIKGVVASKGTGKIIRGTVQIIRDPKNDALETGNVMVTSMTRPEFVPMMKGALAIITDEGGIACHAAIVSRELKKLCVIGTKKSTRVLKDGDTVEIDPNTGIIKKII